MQVKRQQKHFRVPEDVPFIAFAGQTFGGDATALVVARRHGMQVIKREIERLLILTSIAFDLDARLLPPDATGRGGFRQQCVITHCGAFTQRSQRRRCRAIIRRVKRRADPGAFLKREAFARSELLLTVLQQPAVFRRKAHLRLSIHTTDAAQRHIRDVIERAVARLKVAVFKNAQFTLCQVLTPAVGLGGVDARRHAHGGRAINRRNGKPQAEQPKPRGGDKALAFERKTLPAW